MMSTTQNLNRFQRVSRRSIRRNICSPPSMTGYRKCVAQTFKVSKRPPDVAALISQNRVQRRHRTVRGHVGDENKLSFGPSGSCRYAPTTSPVPLGTPKQRAIPATVFCGAGQAAFHTTNHQFTSSQTS
jgi:hypothetical protein